MARVATIAVVGIMALGVPATSRAAPDLGSSCDGLAPVEHAGTIAEPRVIELSGLAGSRQHPDVFWAHNDSGGAPELFAMAADGTSLGAYPVAGATAVDWEDMASGPAPDGSGGVLYVADIGDNDGVRPAVTVYRVPEPREAPAAPGATLAGVEALQLTYPGGPSDAEALLVDPTTGDLVIVTKRLFGASRVFEADAESLVAGAPIAMADAGELRVPLPPDPGGGLPGTMVTGGDVSPDGSLIVLRTYRSVLVYERVEGQSVAEALQGQPCFGPQEEEPQGEAIAFTGDGAAYVTASEGSNVAIHRVELPEPAVSTTTTSPSPATSEQAQDAGDDNGLSIGAALVGAGVLLLLLGGAALFVARRRRASDAG